MREAFALEPPCRAAGSVARCCANVSGVKLPIIDVGAGERMGADMFES
jgi:hypothetical protein